MPKRGEKQSAEARRKISEATLRRYRKSSERRKVSEGRRVAILAELQGRTDEPQKKRCSLCRITKPIEAFYTRRIKLKSGALVQRAESWCRECTRERQKGYRAKEKSRSWAEYRASLEGDRLERYLEKQRQRSTAYRRRRGIPPGTPRIPIKEGYSKHTVPVEPLALLLESIEGGSAAKLALRSGVDERRLTAVLKRESLRVSLRTADRILVGLGRAEALSMLYPPEQPKVGYRVISLPKTKKAPRPPERSASVHRAIQEQQP